MGGIILLKKTLASAIILLFILTSVTPMVVGFDTEIKEKNELLANLAFVCSDRYGGSSKLEYYKEYLLQREDSEDVESEEEIRFVKTPQTSVSSGPMDSAWPMFGHDVRHTGRSPYGPTGNVPVLKWKMRINSFITSSPAIDKDGTIYIGGTADYCLYAINPNGIEKWRGKTDDIILSSPAIGEDGTIYVGDCDGYLYAFYPNGTLKWKLKCGGSWVFSSPTIGDDGIIYVGATNYKFYAVNPNGTIKWSYTTGYKIYSSAAIDDNGIIYIGSHDYNLYAFYPNGTVKWKYKTGEEVKSPPAIENDGAIYVGSWDGYLYAINSDGSLKWKFYTGDATETSPSIALDGTIYVGSYNGKFFAINPDGTEKWRFRAGSGGSDGWVISSPAIDKNGIVYVGSLDGDFYALDPNGDVIWQFHTGHYIESSPAIAEDGTIYFGSGEYLYAIEVIENIPPSKPIIEGPLSGKINEEYNYSFVSTDADGDEISYYIEWGDGTSIGWTRLKPSGELLNTSHTWNQKDTYTVRAKAKDNFDAESNWATLEVSMPKNKAINLWFYWFFEQHPLLERMFTRTFNY